MSTLLKVHTQSVSNLPKPKLRSSEYVSKLLINKTIGLQLLQTGGSLYLFFKHQVVNFKNLQIANCVTFVFPLSLYFISLSPDVDPISPLDNNHFPP